MLNEITELLDREPFMPFRIIVSSGHGYDVTDPHLVALGKSVVHVMRARSDRYDILRQNQVAAVEVLESAK
jgi:hypothetical protein